MSTQEPMVEMYIYETSQLIDQLEQVIMAAEVTGTIDDNVDEVFRIMHTIKGNSMMMMYDGIATVAHRLEDLFDFLRKHKDVHYDTAIITDLTLEMIDFVKTEVAKVSQGNESDGSAQHLIENIEQYTASLDFMFEAPKEEAKDQQFYLGPMKEEDITIKEGLHYFKSVFKFEEGSGMENVRAFTVIHGLKEFVQDYYHFPKELIENEEALQEIIDTGLTVYFSSEEDMTYFQTYFQGVAFLREFGLEEITPQLFLAEKARYDGKQVSEVKEDVVIKEVEKTEQPMVTTQQNFISVELLKVDKLMDLMGELVVSEAMVTKNHDLEGLELDNFEKAARQLRIIMKDLQDVVMGIRMMPLTMTFKKMNRIVRDMKKKINKKVTLDIIGETTEVDKNVIEAIGDPLMHIIRNSVDHGIEDPQERVEKGKPEEGKVVLEARHAGGDVWITIKDDGKGLVADEILDKAEEKELLTKPREDYTPQEAYLLLFAPGFSTKSEVSEFSGRGVGLDVVMRNIKKIGGTIFVHSEPGKGSEFSIKIPLTLAIIDGMMMKVGQHIFTMPIISIKESFSANPKDIIIDPDGSEMVMVRGEVYPLIRLYDRFDIETPCQDLMEGILIMIEVGEITKVIFVDGILGEQQVVVKNIPAYLNTITGITGCALLGDGNISLILDPDGLLEQVI